MEKRVSPTPAKSWYTHPEYTGRPPIRISPFWTVLAVFWHIMLIWIFALRVFHVDLLAWLLYR